MSPEPYSHRNKKLTQNGYIIELNIKAKIIKSQAKAGKNLCHLGVGKDFLDSIPQKNH